MEQLKNNNLRPSSVRGVAIAYALKSHYDTLVRIANISSAAGHPSPRALHHAKVADHFLRCPEFAVDPRVASHRRHNRQHHEQIEISSSLGEEADELRAGELMLMKAEETYQASNALAALEDADPVYFFESAVRTNRNSPKSEDYHFLTNGRGESGSISNVLPCRYILHALALRTSPTPTVVGRIRPTVAAEKEESNDRSEHKVKSETATLNDEEVDEVAEGELSGSFGGDERGILVRLLLESVHTSLVSLRSIVRTAPLSSYSTLDLAKSVWAASPPGLRKGRNRTSVCRNDDDDEDMGDEASMHTEASNATLMRSVLLYTLLVGRLHFGSGGFALVPGDGKESDFVDRVVCGVCSSILSTAHPLSLSYDFANASVANSHQWQAAIKKSMQSESSRFAKIAAMFQRGNMLENVGDLRSPTEPDGRRWHPATGHSSDKGIDDDGEVDPRTRWWGPPASFGSRHIKFVDEEDADVTESGKEIKVSVDSSTQQHSSSERLFFTEAFSRAAPPPYLQQYGFGNGRKSGRGAPHATSHLLEVEVRVPCYRTLYPRIDDGW